jgi:hypothetical protein
MCLWEGGAPVMPVLGLAHLRPWGPYLKGMLSAHIHNKPVEGLHVFPDSICCNQHLRGQLNAVLGRVRHVFCKGAEKGQDMSLSRG